MAKESGWHPLAVLFITLLVGGRHRLLSILEPSGMAVTRVSGIIMAPFLHCTCLVSTLAVIHHFHFQSCVAGWCFWSSSWHGGTTEKCEAMKVNCQLSSSKGQRSWMKWWRRRRTKLPKRSWRSMLRTNLCLSNMYRQGLDLWLVQHQPMLHGCKRQSSRQPLPLQRPTLWSGDDSMRVQPTPMWAFNKASLQPVPKDRRRTSLCFKVQEVQKHPWICQGIQFLQDRRGRHLCPRRHRDHLCQGPSFNENGAIWTSRRPDEWAKKSQSLNFKMLYF